MISFSKIYSRFFFLPTGAEPALPDHPSSHLRSPAHRTHVLQPAVSAGLRQLRAAGARAAVGHQRGRRGVPAHIDTVRVVDTRAATSCVWCYILVLKGQVETETVNSSLLKKVTVLKCKIGAVKKILHAALFKILRRVQT